jgi:hypothetical protein
MLWGGGVDIASIVRCEAIASVLIFFLDAGAMKLTAKGAISTGE